MLKRIALSTMLLTTPLVSQANILIDCANTDDSAITEMPPPINKIMQVNCTVFGHVITSIDGVSMIYAATMQPLLIPAQLSKNPKQRGNANYFKSITHRDLSTSEIKQKYALIKNKFQESKYPKVGVEITTSDNLELEQKVYIFSNKTGYHCAPDCILNRMFIVLNQSDIQNFPRVENELLNTPLYQGRQE
jgi:hypothetical protein